MQISSRRTQVSHMNAMIKFRIYALTQWVSYELKNSDSIVGISPTLHPKPAERFYIVSFP